MSDERDELAETLAIADAWEPRDYKKVAGILLAAGYRKPRTITTAEELDALADKTVFLDRFEYGMVMHPTLRGDKEYAEAVLPATVLWEPTS